MAANVALKGMTWSDPRGYDPLVAATDAFAALHPGVSIHWDKRSLQGFESTPVDQLAAEYDLMIIDHPHVGSVARQGCLLPLDQWIDAPALTALANETVGKSYISYALDGHQWALPVDAATQVQVHRPDLGARVATWDEVAAAARAGQAILPLRPPHSLMCIYTLAANIGQPCGSDRNQLLPPAVLDEVFAALMSVTDHLDPACYDMDPIAVMDRLARDETLLMAPLCYLYKGYANAGYRAHRLAFSDMPTLGRMGPIGSALGGTGIAISARTNAPEICAAFAAWVAGAACQSGLYAASNGQPGNARAWGDAGVNAPVLDAYFNTRMTHEGAWLRPRHNGYMAFQDAGALIVNAALRRQMPVAQAIAALNTAFAASFLEARA